MSSEDHFFSWGEFEHYSEREYFEYLQDNLSEDYYVISSKYIESDDIHYEIDFIVICPNHVYLIEQKCWGDKVIGNDSRWEVHFKGTRVRRYPSPYRTVQKKQRLLLKEIRKIKGIKYFKTTSIIILGSPKTRKIEKDLQGNCSSITFSPEESLSIFRRHQTDSSKDRILSKQIYDHLTRNLRSLSYIQVDQIVLFSPDSWKLELKHEDDDMIILSEEGVPSSPFTLNIDVKSPSPRTESFKEAVDVLKDRLEPLFHATIARNEDYKENVRKICQSWTNTVQLGKIVPNKGYLPFIQLKTEEEIYKYLSE